MYLTTHRIARIRKPGDPPCRREETFVHGFLYTHGDDFSVESADIEEVTTRNPDGQLAMDLTGGIPPGGNAVLSYLDVVAGDDESRDELQESLVRLKRQIERAERLPVETAASETVYVKYNISQRKHGDDTNWVTDFQELADRAIELFELWRDGSAGEAT